MSPVIDGQYVIDPETGARYPTISGGTFILDTSTLGGGGYGKAVTPVLGVGRSIQVTWSQGGNNQDMEIVGYAIEYVPTENAQEDQGF